MGTNIIVFAILFGFALTQYCSYPMSDGATCPYQFNYEDLTTGLSGKLQDVLATLATPAGALGAAAILLGTTVFPNPYLIFFGFAIGLLNIMNTLGSILGPQSGIPDPITGLTSGILMVCFGLAVWSWYAGRDVP
ncbi:MAG: hypothetical protein Sv326_1357 (plasmid) [Candidatus Fermentimicrarchaeum limneticum]|uniref:Uncharacterized protein n=1 Tax=Fermentimicrarchaeum limneticum TaxID=2795018 RepID=A0A7D5XIH7_FERL1|nr:MAG: hypothetical protein Sv326_1357 [Candidatus Fermentimicrarchaeum limneticum]